MSGGSMDYLYAKVMDARFVELTTERRAFRRHLRLVADALRAIEWADSGDGSENDASDAIRTCLGADAILQQSIDDAQNACTRMQAEILQQTIEDAEKACSTLRSAIVSAQGQHSARGEPR